MASRSRMMARTHRWWLGLLLLLPLVEATAAATATTTTTATTTVDQSLPVVEQQQTSRSLFYHLRGRPQSWWNLRFGNYSNGNRSPFDDDDDDSGAQGTDVPVPVPSPAVLTTQIPTAVQGIGDDTDPPVVTPPSPTASPDTDRLSPSTIVPLPSPGPPTTGASPVAVAAPTPFDGTGGGTAAPASQAPIAFEPRAPGPEATPVSAPFSTGVGDDASQSPSPSRAPVPRHPTKWFGQDNPTAIPTPGTSSFGGLTTEEREFLVVTKCRLALDNHTQAIQQVLEEVSTPARFANVETSQYAALQWIAQTDQAVLCPTDENLKQRYILALLYFAFKGDDWYQCSGQTGSVCNDDAAEPWLSAGSECFWYGITCGDASAVNVIRLKENGLSGRLFKELFSLPALSGLSLDHNKNIRGEIPVEIANAPLVYFEFDDNEITGTLPDSLYDMSTLKAIDINNNQISGTISFAIAKLVGLTVLQLENNLLEGIVPEWSFLELPNLRELKQMFYESG